MRILANENIPLLAIESLRQRGHDICWIRDVAPGATDEDVIARGIREKRILITFDKDFGELVWKSHIPAFCGIILFRISIHSPQEAAERIVKAIESRSDWVGAFGVVENDRMRLVPLPS